jgi:hypothetical protein
MTKKLTIDEMREIAKSRGGKCLSKKYINNNTNLSWQCSNGHIWKAVPSNVKSGKWCPKCAIQKRVNSQRGNIKKMQELAKRKNGKCLSKEYINAHIKLRWKCDKKHVFNATPNKIQRGSWCPKCEIQRRADLKRGTIEEMQEIALNRGGWCLSPEYTDNQTKLWWQCDEGHIWEAKSSHIKNSKSWCPYCVNKARLSIEEMRDLAKKRNGECLSKRYINVHIKLKWRCEKNHEWVAIPKDIKKGKWCPECHWEAVRGNGHPRWNGGKFKYCGGNWNIANKSVLRRCKGCSELSGEPGKLDVHHIIPRRNFVDKFVDLCLKPYIEGVDRLAFRVLPYDLIPQLVYDEMNRGENLVALSCSEHQCFENMPPGFFDEIKRKNG